MLMNIFKICIYSKSFGIREASLCFQFSALSNHLEGVMSVMHMYSCLELGWSHVHGHTLLGQLAN